MSDGITAFELCRRVLARTGGDVAPLIALAKGRETGWLEFKATCEPPVDGPMPGTNADDYRWNVAKAIIAMANTDGGCLLLGVDDAGRSVGLEQSDRRGKIQSESVDSFIRHLNQTVFSPTNGWRCEKAGKIQVDGEVPLDLVEPITCHLDGSQILAILIRPREKPLHCIVNIHQLEMTILLVKHLGDIGEIKAISRPRKIVEWEKQRQPVQIVYSDLLRKFEGTGDTPTLFEPSIISKFFSLFSRGVKAWSVGVILLAITSVLGIWLWSPSSFPPPVPESQMWKDIIKAQEEFSKTAPTQAFSVSVGNEVVSFKIHLLRDKPAAYRVIPDPATIPIYTEALSSGEVSQIFQQLGEHANVAVPLRILVNYANAGDSEGWGFSNLPLNGNRSIQFVHFLRICASLQIFRDYQELLNGEAIGTQNGLPFHLRQSSYPDASAFNTIVMRRLQYGEWNSDEVGIPQDERFLKGYFEIFRAPNDPGEKEDRNLIRYIQFRSIVEILAALIVEKPLLQEGTSGFQLLKEAPSSQRRPIFNALNFAYVDWEITVEKTMSYILEIPRLRSVINSQGEGSGTAANPNAKNPLLKQGQPGDR